MSKLEPAADEGQLHTIGKAQADSKAQALVQTELSNSTDAHKGGT